MQISGQNNQTKLFSILTSRYCPVNPALIKVNIELKERFAKHFLWCSENWISCSISFRFFFLFFLGIVHGDCVSLNSLNSFTQAPCLNNKPDMVQIVPFKEY